MAYSKDDLHVQRVEVVPTTTTPPADKTADGSAVQNFGALSEAITPYFATPAATAWRRHYRSFRVGKTCGAHGEAPAAVQREDRALEHRGADLQSTQVRKTTVAHTSIKSLLIHVFYF